MVSCSRWFYSRRNLSFISIFASRVSFLEAQTRRDRLAWRVRHGISFWRKDLNSIILDNASARTVQIAKAYMLCLCISAEADFPDGNALVSSIS